jgi:hypothetical protein
MQSLYKAGHSICSKFRLTGTFLLKLKSQFKSRTFINGTTFSKFKSTMNVGGVEGLGRRWGRGGGAEKKER